MTDKLRELVTMDTDWETMKENAKELGVTITNKEETMEEINRVILKEQGIDNPKWYELHGSMYNEGDIIHIIDGHLKGRFAEVVEPSAKKFAVKAKLINPNNGETQKTTIVLNYNDIELSNVEQQILVEQEQKEVM